MSGANGRGVAGTVPGFAPKPGLLAMLYPRYALMERGFCGLGRIRSDLRGTLNKSTNPATANDAPGAPARRDVFRRQQRRGDALCSPPRALAAT